MTVRQVGIFVCQAFFIFTETEVKQRAFTAVAGVARPSVGVALNGSNQCCAAYLFFYYYFNEIRIFFTPFNVKLFFKIVPPWKKEVADFVVTGKREKLHCLQLWLTSGLTEWLLE